MRLRRFRRLSPYRNFHHEEEELVAYRSELVKRHDVPVLYLHHDLGFAVEARDALLPFAELRPKEFDRADLVE